MAATGYREANGAARTNAGVSSLVNNPLNRADEVDDVSYHIQLSAEPSWSTRRF